MSCLLQTVAIVNQLECMPKRVNTMRCKEVVAVAAMVVVYKFCSIHVLSLPMAETATYMYVEVRTCVHPWDESNPGRRFEVGVTTLVACHLHARSDRLHGYGVKSTAGCWFT